VSQNNRALRSNPNIILKNIGGETIEIRHKITEPYAQIPTASSKSSKITDHWSQNNRALRSNPNKLNWSRVEEMYCHKITEPYAQIPTEDDDGHVFQVQSHKITEPYAQIPTNSKKSYAEDAYKLNNVTK